MPKKDKEGPLVTGSSSFNAYVINCINYTTNKDLGKWELVWI